MNRRIHWIPNMITLGNLSMGFVSILIASEATGNGPQSYILSGFFILLAAICDGLDGMVARALDATSELGADLDSLADLTAFGIAPGFLFYNMVLGEYKIDVFGKEDLFPIGMLIAAIFPACAAYRLARFNVAHDPSSFTGLPSPIAGITIGFLPIFLGKDHTLPHWLGIPLFILIAFLMVSNVRYGKPQVAIRSKLTPLRASLMLGAALIALFFIGIARWPWLVYGLICLYIFSGLLTFLIHIIQELRVKLD